MAAVVAAAAAALTFKNTTMKLSSSPFTGSPFGECMLLSARDIVSACAGFWGDKFQTDWTHSGRCIHAAAKNKHIEVTHAGSTPPHYSFVCFQKGRGSE